LKRLVSFLFFFALAYVTRRTLIPFLFHGGGAPAYTAQAAASAAPAQPSWLVVKFAGLFQHLTGAPLTSRETSALSLGLMLYCILFGRLSSLALGSRGFGALLNGLIGLAGAGAALAALGLVASAGLADGLYWLMGGAVVSSLVALGAAAALKAFVSAEDDTFMRGGETRVGSAAKSLGAGPAAPRAAGPSAARIQAALERRR